MNLPITILYVGSSTLRNRQFVKRLDDRQNITAQVVWIGEGTKAINEHSTICPDVVLVDALSDDLSGVEIARWLKEQNSRTKIVMVSELPSLDFLTASWELGLHGYFPKTIDQRELDGALRDVQRGRTCFTYALSLLVFPKWIESLHVQLPDLTAERSSGW